MHPVAATRSDGVRQVGAIDASETLALARGNAGLLPTAAMYGVPMALRFLKYGSGKGLPRDQLDKGMLDTMIPGRWANYGEMTVGYQEERHGGDYVKQLQNTIGTLFCQEEGCIEL